MITHKIMEDIQMNESIKDRFLKEDALNDDELVLMPLSFAQ